MALYKVKEARFARWKEGEGEHDANFSLKGKKKCIHTPLLWSLPTSDLIQNTPRFFPQFHFIGHPKKAQYLHRESTLYHKPVPGGFIWPSSPQPSINERALLGWWVFITCDSSPVPSSLCPFLSVYSLHRSAQTLLLFFLVVRTSLLDLQLCYCFKNYVELTFERSKFPELTLRHRLWTEFYASWWLKSV